MREKANSIVSILRKKGFAVYYVGGCVRDMVMNKPISDIDIATSAQPYDCIDIFIKEGFRVIPTGIDHGTVTVVCGDYNFEVTTFRKDVVCDGRNATIKFADSIEEDLSRRDFTINAMALCPFTDKVIDLFGGRKDINKKIIATVGDPNERFREDYLRMIRAFRFASILDFTLNTEVFFSIIRLNKEDWLDKVSVERIKLELDKCFSKSDTPSKMINGMMYTGVLEKILPEIYNCVGVEQNKHHRYDVYLHTMKALDAILKEHPNIRWVALFHDLGKVPARRYDGKDYTFHNHEFYSEEISLDIMRRFKFSNKDIGYITNLIRHHMFKCSYEMKNSAIRRFVASLGLEYVDDLYILKYADRVGKGRGVGELDLDNTQFKIRLKKILDEDKILKIKDLAVDGRDVMRIKNIFPSREVGKYLKQLYELVLERPVLNTKERLEALLEKL